MTFHPVEEPEEQNKTKVEEDTKSEVEKAREASEIQKYETEAIKAKQEAIFAENNIKGVDELKEKLASAEEKEAQLGREKYQWDNQKALEESEIQRQKSELEQQKTELDRRVQELASREAQAEIRESLVSAREALMTDVEKKDLEDTEKHNSLTERLKRTLPEIITLMGQNANIFIRCGSRRIGNGLWDEVEIIEEWSKNSLGEHSDTIVEWLRGEIEDCNRKAVSMSRSPNQYGEAHNIVVDNLERMYELLPLLKPDYIPPD